MYISCLAEIHRYRDSGHKPRIIRIIGIFTPIATVIHVDTRAGSGELRAGRATARRVPPLGGIDPETPPKGGTPAAVLPRSHKWVVKDLCVFRRTPSITMLPATRGLRAFPAPCSPLSAARPCGLTDRHVKIQYLLRGKASLHATLAGRSLDRSKQEHGRPASKPLSA